MIVDRKWAIQNLGFDPIATPAPQKSFAVPDAAVVGAGKEDLEREIIDFDSEGPEGAAFFAFSTATGLSRFTDIPWPRGLAPKIGTKPKGNRGSPLPMADVLVVTWTVDEGHALSRVLTPGKDSRDDYVPYTHNFAKLTKTMSKGSPAVKSKRLGAYWTTTIGSKRAVIFKSESHLSQDTNKKIPSGNASLPNADVWKQIISEVRPKLVITTGTAGGIGKQYEVGDVVVSRIVRFDCTKWLKKQPFHNQAFTDSAPNTKYLVEAKKLFKANAGQLPKTNTRAPRIVRSSESSTSVVTTDFFGFDTSNNRYGLQGLGAVSEMGDAVLGLVAAQMGSASPRWVAVRNVSDPQIKAEGTDIQQAQLAAQIYKGFGRWSTVCSAIVCWALIAAEK
jgi:purine-nucleoside phosphorylase